MLHVGGWPPYELLMTSQNNHHWIWIDYHPTNLTGPWHLVICICSCRSIIMVIFPARSKMLATSCIKRTGQVVIISLGAIWGMTSSKLWSTPNLKNIFNQKKSGEKKEKTKKVLWTMIGHDPLLLGFLKDFHYMKLSEYWKYLNLLLWSPILTCVKTLVFLSGWAPKHRVKPSNPNAPTTQFWRSKRPAIKTDQGR